MNVKKYADLTPIGDEQLREEGVPKQFWNYTVNPVTGFSTLKTRQDIKTENKIALGKYGGSNNYTSIRVNGKVSRARNE